MGLTYWEETGLVIDLGAIQVNTLQETTALDEILDKHPKVFSADLAAWRVRRLNYILIQKYILNSTNGLAERAVQSFKQGLKRTTGKSIQDRLSRFLFQYRTTPHSTTPPAELLMGRRLRTHFDLLYPDISRKVESQCSVQAETGPRQFQTLALISHWRLGVCGEFHFLPTQVDAREGGQSYRTTLVPSGSGVRSSCTQACGQCT